MAQQLPLFPLHVVLFPGMRLPLHIFEERYLRMINHCLDQGEEFGVVLIRNGSEIRPGCDPARVGTSARIVEVTRLQDGRMNLLTEGRRRFAIIRAWWSNDILTGDVEWRPDLPSVCEELVHCGDLLRELFNEHVRLLFAAHGQRLDAELELPADCEHLSYFVASQMRLSMQDKQSLLECASTLERICMAARFLQQRNKCQRSFLKLKETCGALNPDAGRLLDRYLSEN